MDRMADFRPSDPSLIPLSDKMENKAPAVGSLKILYKKNQRYLNTSWVAVEGEECTPPNPEAVGSNLAGGWTF